MNIRINYCFGSCVMITLCQDRGARVKNSFRIDATKKKEERLPKV